MKSDDIPMYDDPSTPAYMRELLHAGRNARSDYDAERGLAEHLALTAGVPISPAAHWGASAAAAAKLSLPAWLGFVVLPLAAASVVGLVWVSGSAPTPAPATSQPGTGARAPSESATPTVAGGVSAPDSVTREPAGIAAAASDSHAVGSMDEARSRAALDRRTRTAARSSAAHSALRSLHATSSDRIGSESAAGDLNIESATGVRADDSVAAGSTPPPNPYVGSKSVNAEPVRQDPAQARVAGQDTRAAEQRPEADAATKKPAALAIVDESRLEREMQMLAVTQRVLSSNPERALRLAEQGEREFAGSMFSAERRQLGLLALVRLGRVDEARRAGRPFLARYPNAPWSERLRRALSTGVVE